jgi:hypothetical protein
MAGSASQIWEKVESENLSDSEIKVLLNMIEDELERRRSKLKPFSRQITTTNAPGRLYQRVTERKLDQAELIKLASALRAESTNRRSGYEPFQWPQFGSESPRIKQILRQQIRRV